MKKLTTKVAFIIIIITLCDVVLMKLFHSIYFLRDINTITNRLSFFLIIVSSLTASAVILIIIILSPLQKTLNKLRNGQQVSLTERKKGRSIISRLQIIIIIVNTLGFFVGPLIQSLTGIKFGNYTLLSAVVTTIYNTSIGLLASIIQISWINIVMMEPKKSLQFYYMDDSIKESSLKNKQVFYNLSSAYFAVMIIVSAGFGFITEAVNSSSNLVISEGSYFTEMLVLIGIVLLIIFFVQRTLAIELSTEISFLANSLEQTMKGETDLSRRLSIVHFNELGKLVHFINSYTDYLQNIINEMKLSADKVFASSEKLGNTSEKVNQRVNLLIASNVDVKNNAEKQINAVSQAEEIIDHITQSIHDIFNDIENQSRIVEQNSASINEMSANIESVSTIARQADQLSKSLKEVSKEGGSSVKTTLDVIHQIQEVSGNVTSFITIITKIAAQTNMLAMNAAIEAAHAGDAGRGFAIVADEVRKLAEESSAAAKKITTEIKVMLKSISEGVVKVENLQSSFNIINDKVEQTSQIIHSVSNAMEEQRYAASEILQSITALIEATQHIKTTAANQNEKSSNIHNAMQKIIEASDYIRKTVDNQDTLNSGITEIVKQLNTIAGENKMVVKSLENTFLSVEK